MLRRLSDGKELLLEVEAIPGLRQPCPQTNAQRLTGKCDFASQANAQTPSNLTDPGKCTENHSGGECQPALRADHLGNDEGASTWREGEKGLTAGECKEEHHGWGE